MADKRRVVVTGIGLVSSLGIGTEKNWEGLLAGKSGVGPITKFDLNEFDGEFSTRIAGEVKGFDPLAFIEKKDVKKMDVFIQYAIAEKAQVDWAAQIPLGRLGTGDDIAAAACYLASDEAAYITGHVLAVNGGMSM